MSRVEAKALWEEIRHLLSTAGPLSLNELYDQVECAEDKRQLANCLYLRKGKGLLVHADGRYALPGTKAKKPGKSASKQAPADAPPAREPKPPKPAADPVDDFLKGSLDAAQHALDEYLVSVGDPDLIVQLKGARDYARSALETYRRARS